MAQIQDTLKIPSQAWWARARAAFGRLCQVLTHGINAEGCGRAGQPRISILPSGVFGCQLCSEEDELDCVAFGSVRKGLFVEAAWQNVVSDEHRGLGIRVYEASGQGLLLDISGFLFRIHYVECPELLRTFPEIINTPEEFTSTLRTEVEDAVGSLQEIERWNDNVKDVPALLSLYYFIRIWAISCGLYADNDIGVFDAKTLQEYIRRSVSRINLIDYRSTDLFGMIHQFLLQNETFYQPTDTEHSFGVEGDGGSFSDIKGWTDEKSRTVHEELRSLREMFLMANQEGSGDMWCDSVLKDLSNRQISGTMIKFGHGIWIAMQFSGQSQLEGANMMNFVEEQALRLKQLLKELPRAVEFRIWPTRLVEAGATAEDNPYEGFWLIGISLNDGDSEYSAVESALEMWNSQLHADSRYSPSTMFIQATLVNKDMMLGRELKRDFRKWPRELAQPDGKLGLDPVLKSSKKIPHQSLPMVESKGPRKLRPAMEVLNRLKHDRTFKLDDFVVGYVDRHSGIEEREARKWVTESTDDEWIPQGRIQYFKRISDGTIVWDRASKTDIIFKT